MAPWMAQCFRENHGFSSLIQMFHDVSWCFMMFPQSVRKVKSGETLWQKPTIGPCNCHSMFHPDESDDDHPAVQRNYLSPIVPMFGYTANPELHVKNEHKSIHIYTTYIFFTVCVNYSETIRYSNPRETILEAFDCSIFLGAAINHKILAQGAFHIVDLAEVLITWPNNDIVILALINCGGKWCEDNNDVPAISCQESQKHIDVGPQKLRASTFFKWCHGE